MAGRECYHCKQWVEQGQQHDCWTTTETALTRELPDDLQEAWQRLRETAVEFGEQRIYASHNSIMFAKKACYFFVRPKPKYLEVCVFLGRPLKAPQVRQAAPSSRTKFYNILRITHRDEVEAPITDWLREAYETSEQLSARPASPKPKATARRAAAGSSASPQKESSASTRGSRAGAGAAPASRQRRAARPSTRAKGRRR